MARAIFYTRILQEEESRSAIVRNEIVSTLKRPRVSSFANFVQV